VLFVPLQPPVAVQDVAFVLDHVSCEDVFTATLVGFAVSVTVGAGFEGGVLVTVTLASACVLPPAPVQLSENVELLLSAALCSLPEVAFDPLHAPEAVQDVALVVLQVSVVFWPLATELGCAVRVTVGAAGAGGGLLPPDVPAPVGALSPPPPQAASPNATAQHTAAPLKVDTRTCSAPDQNSGEA
jgi:hypothetical protein